MNQGFRAFYVLIYLSFYLLWIPLFVFVFIFSASRNSKKAKHDFFVVVKLSFEGSFMISKTSAKNSFALYLNGWMIGIKVWELKMRDNFLITFLFFCRQIREDNHPIRRQFRVPVLVLTQADRSSLNKRPRGSRTKGQLLRNRLKVLYLRSSNNIARSRKDIPPHQAARAPLNLLEDRTITGQHLIRHTR